MSDVTDGRRKVRQCADTMRRVATLFDQATALDLHPSLDWGQLVRYVNEELLLAAEGGMWDDADDHRATYEGIIKQIDINARVTDRAAGREVEA